VTHPSRSLILWAVLVFAEATPAHAFKERWHKAITFTALSFLEPETLGQILRVNDDLDAPLHLDTAGVDKWHFNDCDFQGATENINRLYGEALGKNDPKRKPQIDWVAFGQILHVAQDFYAHSNWVSITTDRLVDTGLKRWPVLAPYERLEGGIVVVTGERADVVIDRKPGERTVSIGLPDSDEKANGLISGTAFFAMHCPSRAAIGHWDSHQERGGLAKDYPCREEFWSACKSALRQTLHEWCRLTDLAKPDEGTRAAVARVVKVDQRMRVEALCAKKTYLNPDFSGGCHASVP
jgi:hypothetical protein